MKLSIITVNLNNAAGLARTLDSAKEQTWRDFEHIVIDGGSTDGSREAIESRAAQIAHWVSEPDGGIYAAMNKGLRAARGEYVQFLNSGDWLASPGVLERVFGRNEFAEDLLYGNSLRPDGAGGWKELPQPDSLTVARFWGMGLCHQTVFYKREWFGRLGGYDERYRIVADWDFNFRALLAGCTTRHLPFPVVHYEGRGISATQVDRMEREKEEMRRHRLPDAIYRDYERLMFLEKECVRLKKFEDWAAQIRARNPLLNYAMATKWFWEKFRPRAARRGEGEGE